MPERASWLKSMDAWASKVMPIIPASSFNEADCSSLFTSCELVSLRKFKLISKADTLMVGIRICRLSILPSKCGMSRATPICRSEEHTSELQSRPHLVCRLLLEKKKKKQK